MGLQAGNRLSLTSLAAGMLLASGNDAANACALYLEGSQEAFADRMNARAREVGMQDTSFVTPSGLDDEEHYSTAYDMALLAREALQNESFAAIAGSASMQVEFLEPAGRVSYSNHNKLLHLYEGCVGVKTGFTKKAGRCLVSAARRDGVLLIAVTLNAPDDWDDHVALLDYGFSTVEEVPFDASGLWATVPVVGGDAQTVAVRGLEGGAAPLLSQDASQVESRVLLPAFLYAPVRAGDTVGRVQYAIGGREVYSVPIVAESGTMAQEKQPGFWEKLFHWR